MTRELFITELRRALAVELSAVEIDVHAKYYNEYFSTEMSKGRTEEDILNELGDPRLIAKSILGAKVGEERIHEEEKRTENRANQIRRIPTWLLIALIVIVLIGVLSLVLRLFIGLLPVILIIAAVGLIATFIRRLF